MEQNNKTQKITTNDVVISVENVNKMNMLSEWLDFQYEVNHPSRNGSKSSKKQREFIKEIKSMIYDIMNDKYLPLNYNDMTNQLIKERS
jgi:hypothetical protein